MRSRASQSHAFRLPLLQPRPTRERICMRSHAGKIQFEMKSTPVFRQSLFLGEISSAQPRLLHLLGLLSSTQPACWPTPARRPYHLNREQICTRSRGHIHHVGKQSIHSHQYSHVFVESLPCVALQKIWLLLWPSSGRAMP